MISNLIANLEHMDAIEAELERVGGKPLPFSYLQHRFQLDTDEALGALFKLEEQNRVKLTVSTAMDLTRVLIANQTEGTDGI